MKKEGLEGIAGSAEIFSSCSALSRVEIYSFIPGIFHTVEDK